MKTKALALLLVLAVVVGIGALRAKVSAQRGQTSAPTLGGLISQGFEIKAVTTLPIASGGTAMLTFLQNGKEAYFCRDNPQTFCGKISN